MELKKPHPSRLRQQAGDISETPSTWLTLFDPHPLGDPQWLCPTQLTGPPKLLSHRNGWSWLILHNFLNPIKLATTGLSELPSPNFHTLVKEIDMQVQEYQRIPNQMDAKKPTPRHITIKMTKFKDKERILKAAREKKLFTYRGIPMRLVSWFLKRNFAG